MTCTELDLLVTSGLRVAKVVQKRASILKNQDFANATPRHLATLIERAAQHGEDFLLSLRTEGQNAEYLCRAAQLWFSYLSEMYSHLRYVDRAAARQTPWSLVDPFEELASGLHRGAVFLIRPQWKYNYSIQELVQAYTHVLGGITTQEELNRILEGIPDAVFVTSFAGVERLNVLLHVVLGHEIAHPIANEFLLAENEPSVIQAIKTELESVPVQGLGDLFKRAEQIDTAASVRRGALGELMCDQACVLMFGPAALFALEEWGRTLGWDGYAMAYHHPPWRYRLRCALNLLTRDTLEGYLRRCNLDEGLHASVMARYDRITATAEQQSDIIALNSRIETRIAYELAEQTLSSTQQFIARKLKRKHSGLSLKNSSICRRFSSYREA